MSEDVSSVVADFEHVDTDQALGLAEKGNWRESSKVPLKFLERGWGMKDLIF